MRDETRSASTARFGDLARLAYSFIRGQIDTVAALRALPVDVRYCRDYVEDDKC